MTPAQERWAFAAKIMEMHGDDVGIFVAGRIRDLTDKADHNGVNFWLDIADKVMQLAGPDEGDWTQ